MINHHVLEHSCRSAHPFSGLMIILHDLMVFIFFVLFPWLVIIFLCFRWPSPRLALVARLGAVSRRWRRGTLRGRRGTWRHPPSFHVAGMALGDIHLRFAWQAWHLRHFCISPPSPPPPPPLCHTQLCHTPSFTPNFVTHHLSNPSLSHTIFHSQLCHTHNFVTHNFVTHTTLSHNICHTQLCHTQLCHTQLCHTPSITHTHNFVTLCHTPSFTQNFVTHNSSHTTCFTSRSSSTSFVFPSFPVPLQQLLLIIGRSWLVGLSGPLIYL